MSLEFRFFAGRKYSINGVAYTYVEAYDAERNNPGSKEENAYFFRNDRTRSQEKWKESEIRAIKDQIKERGAGVKIDEVDRPVDLKPSERRIETVLRVYDEHPFPLRVENFRKFEESFGQTHPDTKLPTFRQFKVWVRQRGETGRRRKRDFRDGRGRHAKRKFHPQVEWALRRVVIWFYSARHRSVDDAISRLARFVRTLRGRTRVLRGEDESKLIVMPSVSVVYAAIARARTAELIAAKTSDREASKARGVAISLPEVSKHLDLVVIDSTRADSWIVFIPHLLILLRRPWISLAIDAWTGVLLAVVVTWRDDLEAVFLTVKTSIASKAEAIAGREHLASAEVSGLAGGYLLDNALKQVGTSVKDGFEDVGSSVHWAPKETPEYKAVVERPINTLNTQCLHKLPNGIPYSPTMLRRLGYDPKTDGKPILLETLQERLLDFQAQYNDGINVDKMRSRKLLWDDSVEAHGYDRFGDVEILDDALAQVVTVTITRSGVQWNNLRFHDPDTVTRLLNSMGGTDPPDDFEITRRGRRRLGRPPTVTTKAKIRYSDLREIRVFDYVRGTYEPLPCTLKLPHLVALDFEFIERYKAFAEAHQMSFKTDEDIRIAADGYHRRLENTDMARRVEASRKSAELGRDLGPMPARTGVLRVVAEPGPTQMRPAGAIIVEPMAPRRGDSFMPEVGPRRGGRKKGGATRNARRVGPSTGDPETDAAPEEASLPSTGASNKKRARPPKQADPSGRPSEQPDRGETQLDPDTLLLMSL